MNMIIGIAVVAFFAALLFYQWRMTRNAQRQVGQAVAPMDPVVDARLLERGKVLLYFFSPSCGPCRLMTPRIDAAARQHDNVFKFDVSQSTALARQLGVMATPTTVLVTAGKIETVKLGSLSDDALASMLR
ncbi:MAG: thioredoxin family protein [Sulfuritalea sp.]|nr:thioredoxin family protein [Sulfuritalea sp.]